MNRLSLELPAVNFSGEFNPLTTVNLWHYTDCVPAAPPWPSLTKVTPTFSPRRLKWCNDLAHQPSLPEASTIDECERAGLMWNMPNRFLLDPVACRKYLLYTQTVIREKWGNWMTKKFLIFLLILFFYDTTISDVLIFWRTCPVCPCNVVVSTCK